VSRESVSIPKREAPPPLMLVTRRTIWAQAAAEPLWVFWALTAPRGCKKGGQGGMWSPQELPPPDGKGRRSLRLRCFPWLRGSRTRRCKRAPPSSRLCGGAWRLGSYTSGRTPRVAEGGSVDPG